MFAACANTGKIERRAGKIDDPIERLKYLRAAAARKPKPLAVGRWLASALLTAGLALPGTHQALSRQTPPVTKLPVPTAKAAPVRFPVTSSVTETPDVWPVEQNTQYDLYSNGLRIENNLAIANHPRAYSLMKVDGQGVRVERSQPAGIVFHMTESPQASFEPGERAELKRIGEGLLLYVRSKRAYHFVIDRFGRVHRIVMESDSANHAGNSVWADSQWIYLDLNASFIGVAFEGGTPPEDAPLNDPQIHAAKLLTEMLRGKYNLPAEDCVTHAQVSVNPENMRVGWHTDWGFGFAFRQLGLPDNYTIPNPALYLFGFESDRAYLNATGPGVWKGLEAAELRVRNDAAAHGMTLAQHRKILQQKYKDARSALRGTGVDEENKHAS